MKHRLSSQAGGLFRRLAACEEGAVAPLVAVCAIMLIVAVGVAVDVGRGQVAQSKLQASLDSAGLAAGAIVGQHLDEKVLEKEARKYLDANFAGETIAAKIDEVDGFKLRLDKDNTVVELEARATLPTTFMGIAGFREMHVAARTEITREMKGMEVALVLDVTGSMDKEIGGNPYDNTKKIKALRDAGASLLEVLFGTNDEVEDLWIGVVPFSQSVNVGTAHTDWMEDLADYTSKIYCVGSRTNGTVRCPNDANTIDYYRVSTRASPITRVDRYMDSAKSGWYFKDPSTGARHTWGGCVLERWEDELDITDDTPDVEKFRTYFVDDTSDDDRNPAGSNNNSWRADNGDYRVNAGSDISANKGCPQQAVTTLTNKKADVLAAINKLTNPRGNTHINVGAVWGWRLLSPAWSDLWGGYMASEGRPLEYNAKLSQKAMILMTDGTNTMTDEIMTAYGWLDDRNLGTASESGATTALNNKTLAVCNAMKAKGILIYTIVFGNDGVEGSQALMRNCASQADYYFASASAAELQDAFKAIGDSLSNLRVSK